MKRVGLVFGSRSVEHEISVTTAGKAYEVLRQLTGEYETVPLYVNKDGAWLTGGAVARLLTVEAEGRATEDLSKRKSLQQTFKQDLERLERASPLRDAHRAPSLCQRQPLIIEPGCLPSLEQPLLGLLASSLGRVVGGANDLGRDGAGHRRLLPLGLVRLRQRHGLLHRGQVRRSRSQRAVRQPVEEGARHQCLDLRRRDVCPSGALRAGYHPRAAAVEPV